jgi:hypothetical protein
MIDRKKVKRRRHCGGRKNAAKPAAKPAAPSNSAASSASTKVLDPVGFIQNELQKLQQHGFMKPETHVARARYIEEHGYVPDAGVGMTMSETHPFTIVDLRPNGPAGKAGVIKIGDELAKVDGCQQLFNATLTGDQVSPLSLSLSLARARSRFGSRSRSLALSRALSLSLSSVSTSKHHRLDIHPAIPPFPVWHADTQTDTDTPF